MLSYLVNTLQAESINSSNIKFLIFLCSLFLIIKAISWVFHGCLKIINEKNSFNIRLTYKKYLLKGLLAFPLTWRENHKTGDVIDKINTASNSLFHFSRLSYTPINIFITINNFFFYSCFL